MNMQGAPPIALPAQWSVGVVLGASASGKTRICRELAATHGLRFCDDVIREQRGLDDAGCAICSLPDFKAKGDGLDRLSKVGLNNIPTWMRPYGR